MTTTDTTKRPRVPSTAAAPDTATSAATDHTITLLAPNRLERPTTMTATALPIATRVHAVPTKPERRTPRNTAATGPSAPPRKPTRPPRRPTDPGQPTALLVFDTETTTDHTQALLFGVWRYYRRTRTGWSCEQEGIFHADDLADTNPDGLAALRQVSVSGTAAVDGDHPVGLPLMSRTDFVEKVLFAAAWKGRARVVGFNLPFDLSRLAIDVADGRGRNYGGFSFTLAAGNASKGYTERRHRPRLQIKHLNSHRAQISFASALGETQRWNGDFVDLRTLSFALTGNSYGLDSACAAFGVPGKADPGEHGSITPSYIDYCRRDVAATAELYVAAEGRLTELGIPLTAPYAYSPASLAKALLDSCGIRPVLERHPDTDPRLLGIAMSAFYGGRAECRIRRTPVPVRLVDFTSTYPTLLALLGVWNFIVADQIETAESPDTLADVQALLDNVSVAGCFDPDFYPRLIGFAQIIPDGDILPVRARYNPNSPSWGIGNNHLYSSDRAWYALPDLVASTLLNGRAPRLIEVVRLVPTGIAEGIHEVVLPGGRRIDARRENPFTVMTELRQLIRYDSAIPKAIRDGRQLFFKIASNAGGFGIWAEYNAEDLPKGDHRSVTVNIGHGDSFEQQVHVPEKPGRFCYPPLAAVITAAARLLLALIERCVTDFGGTWAVADTDSMAIVATETGGPVACAGGQRQHARDDSVLALSYAQVNQIRNRFATLNPYSQTAIPGTILKSEVDAWCYAIAAKRYALFRFDANGLPRLVQVDEHATCRHGLGHLLNPIDPDDDPDEQHWIIQLWEYQLASALTPNFPGRPPTWFGVPALSRIAATSPLTVSAFRLLNAGKDYARQIKPFNFLMFAPGAQCPAGFDGRFRIVAPFAGWRLWDQLQWINLHPSATTFSLSTDPARPSTALQATYKVIANRYLIHPERKSSQHELPCGPHTVGLLERRYVQVSTHSYLGKESNKLDEREGGQLAEDDFDEHQMTYLESEGASGWPRGVLHLLKRMDRQELAARAMISPRRMQDILEGRAVPRAARRALLLRLAKEVEDRDERRE